eukprot:scaffold1509_cov96-Cylindrotheca_fusiformis.AAC.1
MTEDTGGSGPSPSPPGASPAPAERSSRSRNRNRRGNRSSRGDSSFEGRIEALKGHVYDIESHLSGKTLFANTTEAIAEYFAANNDNAGEFRNAFKPDALGFIELKEPAPPDDPTNFVQAELWKLKIKRWESAVNTRNELIKQAYALIMGQCSVPMRNRLKAHKRWDKVNEANDVIGLLEII